ncbi:MAG: hypothetical protein AB8I69_24035 [Anaerolineae bacterium]|jgi:hypothetical protein
MLSRIKHLLIGPPLPIHQAVGQRLDKVRALAAFSPDALSSIAYVICRNWLSFLTQNSPFQERSICLIASPPSD